MKTIIAANEPERYEGVAFALRLLLVKSLALVGSLAWKVIHATR